MPNTLDGAIAAAVSAAEIATRPLGHKGYWRLCDLVGRRLGGSGAPLTVRQDDFAFTFPRSDAYWLRLLGSGFEYEPEMAFVLRAIASHRYLFLDCGANLGYWSAQVSSRAFGAQPAIAIEADTHNYEQLAANAALNGNRFETLHRALWERSGEQMKLYGSDEFPEDFSLAAPSAGAPARGVIETVALDDVVRGDKAALPVVIKLDVEGVEAQALSGGTRLLAGGCLVLYEDHGGDRAHASSRWFLDRGGYRIWALASDGLVAVDGIADIARLKTSRVKGYNFAATRIDSPWSARLAPSVKAAR